MGTLTLVKHSLPHVDSTRPPSQWSLSDIGRSRCLKLATHLGDLQNPTLFASPEPKASETAGLLAEQLKIPVAIIEDLREHKRETVGVMTEELFVSTVRAALEHPDQLVFGEETAHQAQQRFCTAVEGIVDRNPDANPIVVAHGTVISLFLARKSHLDPVEIWRKLGLPSFVQVATPGFEVLRIQGQLV